MVQVRAELLRVAEWGSTVKGLNMRKRYDKIIILKWVIIVAKRLTISIDEEVYEYLEHAAGDNRSAFINELLRQHHLSERKAQMIRGLQEDERDLEYQEEIADWAVTLNDGLDDAD
jgi:hypothetical protein